MSKVQTLAVLVCIIVTLRAAFAELNDTSSNPKVNISSGEIEGRFLDTGRAQGHVFQGIPYAEPPVGDLRFHKPVPKNPWNGTLLCQEYRATCYQNLSGTKYNVSEDCLFLNVFAGLNCTNENSCPVLYYLHGGAWEFESPNTFPPETLVENFASKDIVMVSAGYRLGIAGFWSTGTDDAAGNWAMEDMIEGARWIQREIHNFGGDKRKVTILGLSSSSSAVSLLTMSKKTIGLFHQAILMSGSGVDGISNDISLYQELSITLGCATKRDWKKQYKYEKIVQCMRTIPINTLVTKFNEIRGCVNCSFPPSPLTRPRNDGPNGLFPNSMEQMLAERPPITTMAGTTLNEMGYQKLSLVNATASTAADRCESIVRNKDYSRKRKVTRECKKRYVANADPSSYNDSDTGIPFWAEQTTTLDQDSAYFGPCFKDCSTLRSAGSKVYLYSFDYVKEGLEGIGPWHAQDLPYLMDYPHHPPFDLKDYEISDRYVSLFVNFIKYGNPTPQPLDNVTWIPLEKPFGFNYLSIDTPVKMKPDYHKSGVLFWNYKVPLIENGIVYDGNKKLDPELFRQEETGDSVYSSSKWQYAFWVVVACLVGVLTAVGAVSMYLYRKRKLTKREERKSLLSPLDNFDNYKSF